MQLLKDKVAIVTGGTRGIGRAIVECFVSHGAKVIFTYLSSEKTAKELEEQLEGAAISYKMDASNYKENEEFIEKIKGNTFFKGGILQEGVPQIDILVNNAGITKDNLLLRMKKEQWDDVINTNLNALFYLTKFIVDKSMIKRKKGSIIHISSVVGVRGNAGQANYAASKAGIIGFSSSISKELGSRNIRSNVVAPGFIETNMTEVLKEDIKKKILEGVAIGKLGQAKDIANACLFLASDLSSYITGEVLNVNGGM